MWERSQVPVQHTAWDIRFNHIGYLDETDDRGYHLMDYRTNIALGITIKGYGRYLTDSEHSHSSFEFDSDDWKSIIRNGRGIWLYRPCPGGTLFKTVYDYDVRHGWIGSLLDAAIFRRLLQLATEWGFETLRQWCAGDNQAPARRRGRLPFVWFYLLMTQTTHTLVSLSNELIVNRLCGDCPFCRVSASCSFGSLLWVTFKPSGCSF